MNKRGFTIVELLIVIVVIAILAAISIVAYNGIQQRSRNTQSIAAARQVVSITQGYIAAYGAAPATNRRCVTADNSCTNPTAVVATTDNTAIITELRKIGNPPESSLNAADGAYGIQYNYLDGATFNGSSAPVRIEYYLQGNAQKCGLSNVTNDVTTGTTSTTGYSSTTGNRTVCQVMLLL